MILELSDQDNVALEEISKILERHPDLKLIEMVVEPTLIFNHLIIDTGKRKVYYNQQEVLLTTKEYELGVKIGSIFGSRFEKQSGILGCIILILIGIKIFVVGH